MARRLTVVLIVVPDELDDLDRRMLLVPLVRPGPARRPMIDHDLLDRAVAHMALDSFPSLPRRMVLRAVWAERWMRYASQFRSN